MTVVLNDGKKYKDSYLQIHLFLLVEHIQKYYPKPLKKLRVLITFNRKFCHSHENNLIHPNKNDTINTKCQNGNNGIRK